MLSGVRRALPRDLTQLTYGQGWSHFGRRHEGTTRIEDGPKVDSLLGSFTLRHYFHDGWSADTVLSAGSIRLDPPGDPPEGSPTRRVTGLGDLEVGGSYDFAALWGSGGYRPSLRLRAGVGLPTGREAIFEEARGEASFLSLGLASWNTVAEVTFTQFLHRRLAVIVPLSARFPLSSTENRTHFGDVYRFGASGLVILHDRLLASAGLEHEIRGYATVEDDPDTPDDDSGRLESSGSDVTRAVFNASAKITDSLSLFLGLRLPVRVDVDSRQITESFTLQGGLTFTFGEHRHDDRDHGEAADTDHADPHDH